MYVLTCVYVLACNNSIEGLEKSTGTNSNHNKRHVRMHDKNIYVSFRYEMKNNVSSFRFITRKVPQDYASQQIILKISDEVTPLKYNLKLEILVI